MCSVPATTPWPEPGVLQRPVPRGSQARTYVRTSGAESKPKMLVAARVFWGPTQHACGLRGRHVLLLRTVPGTPYMVQGRRGILYRLLHAFLLGARNA